MERNKENDDEKERKKQRKRERGYMKDAKTTKLEKGYISFYCYFLRDFKMTDISQSVSLLHSTTINPNSIGVKSSLIVFGGGTKLSMPFFLPPNFFFELKLQIFIMTKEVSNSDNCL